MSFGPYPDVSLAEARVQRDQAKANLRSGGDPMAPRRAVRKGKTLAEASVEYWSGRKDVSESYRSNAMRGIEMHLIPELGSRNIATITRDDLLAILNRVDAAGRHVYVRKIRMWVGQVFEWAVEQGCATINPAALIRPEKAFGRAKVESFAALELRDVPAFMERLAMECELQSVIACRMLAYSSSNSFTSTSIAFWINPRAPRRIRSSSDSPISGQSVGLSCRMFWIRAECRRRHEKFFGRTRQDFRS
jgi:hypothetical protein